ncbi:MAG: hypothetical protein ACF788_10835 [Novipirellula sp. JB048]
MRIHWRFGIAILASLGISTALEAETAPSAKQILESVKTVYLKSESYEDQGTVEVRDRIDREFVEKEQFHTRFIRHKFFAFDFEGDTRYGETYSVVMQDGVTTREWSVDEKRKTCDSLPEELRNACGTTSSISCTIPLLLLGQQNRIFQANTLERIDDRAIDEMSCYRILLKNGASESVLWVDHRSFLIRRIDTLRSTSERIILYKRVQLKTSDQSRRAEVVLEKSKETEVVSEKPHGEPD